jgi:hypothetical protein
MFVSGEIGNLQYKLQQLQKQQSELDSKIKQADRSRSGALNMDFFRLKKQKGEIKEQVVKIYGMLRPDIIA